MSPLIPEIAQQLESPNRPYTHILVLVTSRTSSDYSLISNFKSKTENSFEITNENNETNIIEAKFRKREKLTLERNQPTV